MNMPQTIRRRLCSALPPIALAALLVGFVLLPGLLFRLEDRQLNGRELAVSLPSNTLSAEGAQIPLARCLYENRLLYSGVCGQQTLNPEALPSGQALPDLLAALHTAGALDSCEYHTARQLLPGGTLSVSAGEDGVVTYDCRIAKLEWLARAGLSVGLTLSGTPAALTTQARLAAWKQYLGLDPLTDWETCLETETALCQYSAAGQLFLSVSGSEEQIGMHVYSLSPEDYASLVLPGEEALSGNGF